MSGRPEDQAEADVLFEEAVQRHRARQLVEAETLYAEVLIRAPGHTGASHNLGVLWLQQKRASEALPLLAHAARHDQGKAQNWITYIHALVVNENFEPACDILAACRSRGMGGPQVDALEVRLNHAWALALKAKGDTEAAQARIERALEVAPKDADLWTELGSMQGFQRRWTAAEASYRRALGADPRHFAALANLASSLRPQGREAEAETYYRQALAVDPTDGGTHRNLAGLLRKLGRTAEARASYLEASRLGSGLEATIMSRLALPAVAASAAAIDADRRSYADGLAALAADGRTFAYGGERSNCPWFYLAYHGRDDRALMDGTAAALGKLVPALAHVSPGVAQWRAPAEAARRIRVVFCSAFLTEHTIGRLNRGFIQHLNRSRFEVIVAHGVDSKRSALREALNRTADQVVDLAREPARCWAQIEALAPDVLFYPDIGMDAQTYFLAHARLAPVQATTWGHPSTTGLKTIDYFLSSQLIEPEGSQDVYTERLVQMSRMNTFYARPEPPAAAPRREALGLPARGTLYVCSQSHFKLHPDFDPVLAQIAAGDPDGHIVLMQPQAGWLKVLRDRWAATHPILLERVVFLPRLDVDGFLALLDHADVLLDTPHFGGGNTFYESMVFGTPTVTWPSPFMRARLIVGAYRQMGVAEAPIARRLEDYAELALALGRDPERRVQLRKALKAAAQAHLFSDMAAVRELEAFLTAAVDAAARGERLAEGWSPEGS